MDSDEEWLFDSVKNYKNLFMYDLQHPVTCFDWIGDKNLAVATSSVDKNEIIELSLPDKLVSHDELADLCKDRDFHQTNGGFSKSIICCIKHIPQSRLVCTSNEREQGIQVWQLGSMVTDLVTCVNQFSTTDHSIPNQRCVDKIAVCKNKPSIVVFGSCWDHLSCLNTDVQKVTDVTEKSERTDNSCISEIKFLDENTLVICIEKSGEIILLDIRSNKSNLIRIQNCSTCNKDRNWTMDVTENQLYRLSSAGNIVVSDIRNGENNVIKEVETNIMCKENSAEICIKASPIHKNRVSVSGFDGNICIYDTTKELANDSKCSFTEPIFIHEGHVKNMSDQSDFVKTVAHLWHPWKQDLLMSSATDGSLHAWEYCLL